MKTTQQYAQEILDRHNLTLTSEYTGAHKVVTFNCPNGHQNEGTATNILQRGYKCKECLTGRKIQPKIKWTEDMLLPYLNQSSEDIAKIYNTTKSAVDNAIKDLGLSNSKTFRTIAKLEAIVKEQERTILSISKETAHGVATIKCKNGHVAEQFIGNVVFKHSNCPSCIYPISREEQTLQEYVKEIYQGWTIYSDRSILEGKELDIVLPDLGVAIEYNGVYWHSKYDKNYHKNKTDEVEAFGFQLIHINSYDWAVNRDIVKARLKAIIAPRPDTYARNTAVKEIKFPKDFLNTHHLQGSGQPTSINIGLYYSNELVSVMTFGKPRFSEEAEYELIRYASSISVHGGASKLYKYFIKTYRPKSVMTYADRDYSKGKLYETLGFTYLRTTEPGFAYFRRTEKISRYAAQGIEADIEAKGFNKVYNSGNLLYLQQFTN